MARGARRSRRREIGRHVIRHIAAESLRAVPGRLMATQAIGARQVVIIVDVARRTGRGRGRHMRPHKGETRGSMVKRTNVGPGDGVMARGAILRLKLRT